MLLYRLAEIVFEDSAITCSRRAEDNIPESYVVHSTRSTAANSYHHSDSDVGKRMKHIPSNNCSRAESIFAIRKHSDGYVVVMHSTKCITVVVPRRNV
jgi:hypothetical protein